MTFLSYRLLFWLLHWGLALFAAGHILLTMRRSRSAAIWILWVCFLPVAGVLLYFYLGINRIAVRTRHRPVSPGATRAQGRLRALSDSIVGTPWRKGNGVKTLVDGEQAFEAMLAAIDGAKRSVGLETYIYDGDAVGNRFATALERAAKRGVQVRVLVDGMGGWGAKRNLVKRLKDAGGVALAYWSLDDLFRQPLLNLRNHRKLMVVDGRVAFTGGMNISAQHTKGAWVKLRRLVPDYPPMRDVHFEIEGPLVADLQAVFARDWSKVKGSPLRGPAWELHIKPAGAAEGRVVPSGPDENLEKIYELTLAVLPQARHRVDICTPYFIPDTAMIMTLRGLGHAGVKVRLFVPRWTDHPFMVWAARESYAELLAANVEVWEIHGRSFVHSKITRVDEDWCFVGSSNMDPRSLRLNFELNVELRSRSLAKRLDEVLEVYRSEAKRVDIDTVLRRSLWVRLRGAIVHLWAPYL
jgi:cardiolipin synthase